MQKDAKKCYFSSKMINMLQIKNILLPSLTIKPNVSSIEHHSVSKIYYKAIQWTIFIQWAIHENNQTWHM